MPDVSSYVTFGELLKHLRLRAGLTQQEFGLAVGYSHTHVGRLENGKRLPTVAVVRSLFAEALGIQSEPELLERLVRLAAVAHGDQSSTTMKAAQQVQSPRPRLTNLPAQLTRFIGRERELAEVVRLLGQRRLLTLTGAAGMGKTRLAIEAAGAALDQFVNGAWLVELAPLADEAQVAQVVASVFQIPDRSGRPPIDALTTFLGEKQMLLILDNCEHLIEACAQLADTLLRACLHLHILATSREPLRISGEATWRVPPLSTPDPVNLPPLEHVVEYDAVRFFIEHASLAQPGFTLTPDNLALIAGICHRLDGMPLAIEMAAVKTTDLGIGGVATGLDDRFALLTNGSRTSLSHHRTLRATLDWSYHLLTEPERLLLARLSVFAGGWTAEAAKHVCADPPPSLSEQGARGSGPEDVLPLLLYLVRKSLVATTPQEVAGGTRYRLLETVRQYADEKLRERREVEALRDRHLAYFLSLAEETMDIGGPHFEAWVRRVGPEYDNMRAALAWANTRDDRGEMALRLSSALGLYWFYRSYVGEGLGWLDKALARGSTAPAYARARALLRKAILRLTQGDLATWMDIGEASLALFRQTDDRIGTAWCLETLANNMADPRAQELAEEARALFRELGSLDGEARALRALGTCTYRAGDHTQAAQFFEQAFTVAHEAEDWWEICACLDRLHDVNPRRALELCVQELAHLRERGNESHLAWILQTYGVLLVVEGEYERARPVLEESVQRGQRADAAYYLPIASFFTLIALGYTEWSLGQADRALAWLEKARMLARETGVLGRSCEAQLMLAAIRIAQGAPAASSDTRECLQQFNKYDLRREVVCLLLQLADLAGRCRDLGRATRLLGAAKAFSDAVETRKQWYGRVLWRWHHDAQHTIVEPTLAAARAQLGDAEFETAYAAGQHMTLDQAVAYALQEDEVDGRSVR